MAVTKPGPVASAASLRALAPPEIVAAALAATRKWRVPASVQIAQWKIESGNGVHCPGCNPFGMKPRAGKNDPQQMLVTTEFTEGRIPAGGAQIAGLAKGWYRIPQPFRVFPTIAAAFDAHAELIATAKVYAPAMAALPDLTTFVGRLAARYATDPLYGHKLLATIASADLGQLDRIAA